GLDQGEGLEHLVEGAEAAGEEDEAFGVLHEHGLAAEKVTEVEGDVDVRVGALLFGQLDVAADGQAVGLVGAAVGGLHDAGSAAGDDGEAGLGQASAEVAGSGVHRVGFGRACRAEHGDGGPDVGEYVEGVDVLAGNAQHAPGV